MPNWMMPQTRMSSGMTMRANSTATAPRSFARRGSRSWLRLLLIAFPLASIRVAKTGSAGRPGTIGVRPAGHGSAVQLRGQAVEPRRQIGAEQRDGDDDRERDEGDEHGVLGRGGTAVLGCVGRVRESDVHRDDHAENLLHGVSP